MLNKQTLINKLLLGSLLYSFLIPVFSVSLEKVPKWFEPQTINKSELNRMLKNSKKWFNSGRHIDNGLMGIKLASISYDRVSLKIRVDPTINLWRGKANYLATKHGGTLLINIKSVSDKNGKTIYRADKEKPWNKKVTLYLKKNSGLEGSREFYVDDNIKLENIGVISAVAKLTIPINLKRYLLKLSATNSLKFSQQHSLIKSLRFKDHTLSLLYRKADPNATVVVYGYDTNNELLQVVLR